MIGMFSYPVDEPTGRPTAQEMWRGSSIQGSLEAIARAGFRFVSRLKGHHQMRSLPKGEVPGVMRGTLGGKGIK